MAEKPKEPHWYDRNKGKLKEEFNRAGKDERQAPGGGARGRDGREDGEPPGAPPAAGAQRRPGGPVPGRVGQAVRREQEEKKVEPQEPQPTQKMKPPKGRDGPSF
ncbi:MAG: hypothetical protein H6923_08985 [Alphaproteobacteria bacterium]|nr:hypothetical protein [Alphaproteobacteria bacterium]